VMSVPKRGAKKVAAPWAAVAFTGAPSLDGANS
jgi:hypothetical protein